VPEPIFKQYVYCRQRAWSGHHVPRFTCVIGRKLAVRGGPPSPRNDGHNRASRRRRGSKKSHTEFNRPPRHRDGSAIVSLPVSRQDSNFDLPHELLSELQNHRDLLAQILEPICDRDRAALELSERRLVAARLLADLERLCCCFSGQLCTSETRLRGRRLRGGRTRPRDANASTI